MEKTNCNHCCTKVDKLTVKIEDNLILDNVSLHLHCNEITMIVGKNGAGKSTLIKAMLGEKEYTGNISFTSKHTNSTKLTIGYVPQRLDIEASPMSVYDLISSSIKCNPTFLRKSKKKHEDIKKHLKEFGVDTYIDKRVCDLSGGQLQRVLIAMATLPYPELLIMDEPISGIDAKGKKEFFELIKKIKETHDISVLIVSHEFEYIKGYADKVILLNKKILKSGPPEEVLSSEEFKNEFKVGMV